MPETTEAITYFEKPGKRNTQRTLEIALSRAVRRKLGTYEVAELVAFTLRIFGEGVKVAAEIACMAADAGLARTDEPALAIAGTGRGADTAIILRPANTARFLDMKIEEIVCMPYR
jgi:hypothetical protein